MDGLALTLTFGGIAALGNVVGGALIVAKRSWDRRVLTYCVAFGGGFLLAASLLKMVPTSLSHAPTVAPFLLLAGYFLIHFFAHVLGEHVHLGGEPHHQGEEVHHAVGVSTIIGLVIHTFFDGLAIGSGFALNNVGLGVLVFCAIMLHKIPEGFTIASITLASGGGRKWALAAAVGLAGATLMGALSVFAVDVGLAKYALPLATGVTIHVAASDLIPEVNEVKGIGVPSLVLAGAVAFYVTERWIEQLVN
ncbi:MAG: ZIP family metal transporter [Abditibacteriales bacterium]|nr:ZIP family metal transporter [Abditibacteriales bacterium]MDW8367176.1 ZIP family metal transporter [Abditibacteriales bacterium]